MVHHEINQQINQALDLYLAACSEESSALKSHDPLQEALHTAEQFYAKVSLQLAEQLLLQEQAQNAYAIVRRTVGYTSSLPLVEAALHLMSRAALAVGCELETEVFQICCAFMNSHSTSLFGAKALAQHISTLGAPMRALGILLSIGLSRGEALRYLGFAEDRVQEIEGENQGRRSLCFATLPYSGASAIEPILRHILSDFGYDVFGTNHLAQYASSFWNGSVPLYVWTHHSPMTTLPATQSIPGISPVLLVRDPRDVLVSAFHDRRKETQFSALTDEDAILAILRNIVQPFMRDFMPWLSSTDTPPSLVLRFTEMKADLQGTVIQICAHLGLALDAAPLTECINRFSFQAMSGRSEGETGPVVRNKYLFRRGASGEWRETWSSGLLKKVENELGPIISLLGYEI